MDVKDMKKVAQFPDGAQLFVSGKFDDDGLPETFIKHADPVREVVAHKIHQGMVEQGDLVDHVEKCSTARVLELVKAGTLQRKN